MHVYLIKLESDVYYIWVFGLLLWILHDGACVYLDGMWECV